jgi:hypothetical protein
MSSYFVFYSDMRPTVTEASNKRAWEEGMSPYHAEAELSGYLVNEAHRNILRPQAKPTVKKETKNH